MTPIDTTQIKEGDIIAKIHFGRDDAICSIVFSKMNNGRLNKIHTAWDSVSREARHKTIMRDANRYMRYLREHTFLLTDEEIMQHITMEVI